MKKLLFWWSELKSTFWFIPVFIIISGITLAIGLVYWDSNSEFEPSGAIKYFFPGSPDSAKDILTIISGAMIGVAGTVFSITLVALTLASNQFGPRLVKNFMYDRINQTVLGTYVSLFIYCLIVLNTVKDTGEMQFIPLFSVAFALLMAIANIVLLIVFIHHVAISIQADHIIGNISINLSRHLAQLFPQDMGDRGDQQIHDIEKVKESHSSSQKLTCDFDGYLQYIDSEALMKDVSELDVFLDLYHRPGSYLVKDLELGEVYAHRNLKNDELYRLRQHFLGGKTRTPQQDAEHAIHQMVEIAARALSPGINDPYTAISCIDNLCSSLAYLTSIRFPSPYRVDASGTLRIKADVLTFAGMMDAAFNAIRQYARDSPPVIIRLMEAMITLSKFAKTEEQKGAIKKHAEMTWNLAKQQFEEKRDLEDLEKRYKKIP
ncbi:DUF2254 domain-containing protein [Cyclobacterium plantarum]|uniref:DUF2254 domain-containing protein n=1 Tax=Cyclobacterium plantarum TaxID=2716263 RepID=A0ABX0HFA2_9BACT|nr:DUF2254 domain-containing protein [Cyclobacterium plantarum]NHE59252.1 DUF2254 domain-containing protein [Cyclobacterium plantarum]